jgi:hypothetical protein
VAGLPGLRLLMFTFTETLGRFMVSVYINLTDEAREG